MLIDKVSDPWIRFKVLFAALQKEKDKREMARETFLHVVANYNAFAHQKIRMLDFIVGRYPDVTKDVSDEEISEHFKYLCDEMHRRNQIVSPAELVWVGKYVGNVEARTEIEKLIYLGLLRASSHWDGMRQLFNWTISDDDKAWLVKAILGVENLGSKRKMELAEEFGEPKDKFVNAYYKKLLWDRHYAQAAALKVHEPDIVVDVIILNINGGYFREALDVAQRFIPSESDVILEIQEIIVASRD